MASKDSELSPDRLLALGRASLETHRYAFPDASGVEAAWRSALATVPPDRREGLQPEVDALIPATPDAKAAAPRPADAPSKGAIQEWMQKAAGLELKLKTEADRYATLDSTLKHERENHQQAIETLGLQQRKLKELQETNVKLVEESSRLEAQLRVQINQTEQVQLQLDTLKNSRQAIGGQVTGQAEQINQLKAENQALREQLAGARAEVHQQSTVAETKLEVAESHTADAEFERLWKLMNEKLPEVFIATHVPNSQTFERVDATLLEFVRVFATLEKHVHEMLKSLRIVSDPNDKIGQWYQRLTRAPGLVELLNGYLATGRGWNNCRNLLRALHAWTMALATGLHKVILQAPTPIAEQLNFRKWPIKLGYGEEANVGKYFKETARQAIPDQLGTLFKKQAGDLAHEDFNMLASQRL